MEKFNFFFLIFTQFILVLRTSQNLYGYDEFEECVGTILRGNYLSILKIILHLRNSISE